jgi:hypothetical protein
MKRAVFIFSLIVICLAVSRIAFSQSDADRKARADAGKVCPFSIVGLWRSVAITGTIPIVFDFSAEGWVALLGPSSDTLPQDFETITTVTYKLDKPAAPGHIEFTADRGNDAFPRGTTSMQILLYSDDSFITVNPVSGHQAEWVRMQTHRYFLTFAARTGTLQHDRSTFAMLTTLDGRQTKVEALGVQMTKAADGKALAVFGPIAAELYDQLTDENDRDKKSDKGKKSKDEIVLMRLELTAAEFKKTHSVFEVWEKYVKTQALPRDNPYQNVMEFLRRMAESLDRCDEKLKLQTPTQRERDEIVSKYDLPQHPVEYVRITRKKNGELHVRDAEFPWGWKPVL